MTGIYEGDLPLVERTAVRLVVLDLHSRVLLLHIREPMHPEQGSCWELPGGGIDPGETVAAAACRELREETGIIASPTNVGAASWHRRVTFRHAGTRRVQAEHVVPIRLTLASPPVDSAGQLADETPTYLGARWWSVPDIENSAERFYPGRLPTLLRTFLAGETIEEPFEHFS